MNIYWSDYGTGMTDLLQRAYRLITRDLTIAIGVIWAVIGGS